MMPRTPPPPTAVVRCQRCTRLRFATADPYCATCRRDLAADARADRAAARVTAAARNIDLATAAKSGDTSRIAAAVARHPDTARRAAIAARRLATAHRTRVDLDVTGAQQ